MNTITISGRKISRTLYFQSQAQMIIAGSRIMCAGGRWDHEVRQYSLYMRANNYGKKIYYTDKLTPEAFRVIHGYVVKWMAAEAIAKRRAGEWVWRYYPAYLRRQFTVLQLARMEANEEIKIQ